ncbi:hypothetical protein IWW36_003866 [Coemansia brasiliensis]|uniref:Uncharacterized protein n=1 Tax=Coemansia brasiliensis TaxID=2650707 RepID=A0A9W8I9D9_9FUNG|nr:hypothetical protein IWW36_003866 [Coemansia brasiliensis]
MEYSDDKDRKRLICLDTESSICLSFDKSLYDDKMPLAPAYGQSKDVPQLLSLPAMSSESNLIPRIQEINGSSDSQHRVANKPPKHGSNSGSMSSNDQSMATADMVLSDADDGRTRADRNESDLDLELQAAVDLMLQGSMSSENTPYRAYYMGNRPLASAFEPPYPVGASELEPPFPASRPGLPRRMMERGKLLGSQLGAAIAGRFKRRTSPDDLERDLDEETPETDREGSKRVVDESMYKDVIDEKPAKCTDCAPTQEGQAAPSRMARMASPILRYMQRRPMATLGIVLGVLVALLVVIIIILIVGVFPFLIRATLQDVSLVVTSVHANAPLQVSRALHINKIGLPSRDIQHHGLHKRDEEPTVKPHMPAAHPKSVAAPSSAAHLLEASSHHSESHLHPSSSVYHAPASSVVQRMAPHTTGNSGNRAIAQPLPSAPIHQDAVTVTRTAMSTVHLVPYRPAPSPSLEPSSNLMDSKALDAEVAPLKYSMQIAGNLTSGGPIGVDIEFTEPLRMYWRDIEVGSIEKPESIHVPGRGTTQWSWPSFDVMVSQAPAISGANKKLEIPHKLVPSQSSDLEHSVEEVDGAQGTSVAQRRLLGGTMALGRAAQEGSEEQDNLADWFAAIREHRSFSMQWKSRVRVSAMGLHTSNVKFEKTVRITCASTKDCVISE